MLAASTLSASVRDRVWLELQYRTPGERNIQHALSVERAMRVMAEALGHKPDVWGLAGLAHDLDIHETQSDMPRHGVVGAALLAHFGAPAEVVYALKSHDDRTGFPRRSILDKALYCADQGYWVAMAPSRPRTINEDCSSTGLKFEKIVALSREAIERTIALKAPVLTSAPSGPFRIDGSRILDSHGRPFLIRGTRFPTIARVQRSDFGPFSLSSFATIRHRANMNAVRLPIDVSEYAASVSYRSYVRDVVAMANRFELLAILEATGAPEFWRQIGRDFGDESNTLMAGDGSAVAPLRSAGVMQPIIVRSTVSVEDSNVIYDIAPFYADLRNQTPLWRAMPTRVPVLVSGLDPELNTGSPECSAFPQDPGEASRLVSGYLKEFDDRSISWTLSSFEPGKLITEYRYYNWSKLDDGWTCGKAASGFAGIGMALVSHLWKADALGIFAVAQQRGGFQIARGAVGTIYGRILSDVEVGSAPKPPPFRLGNISVRVTDALGVARPARLLSTGRGWSYTTFLVPHETALGPAEVAVVRRDGTVSAATVIVSAVAPALWSATHDGRGPVIASANGRPLWKCEAGSCRTVPVDPSATEIRIEGTGFRHAASKAAISARVGGKALQILDFGQMKEPGRDYVVVRWPAELRGRGETDLVVTVHGELSNVVRIHCGTQPSAKALLGRYLFYDKKLSINGTTSCATCHRQELAFTDGHTRAVGATGEVHPRNSMSLVNVSENAAFNRSNPTIRSLESHALKTLLSMRPLEIGFPVVKQAFLNRLRTLEPYRSLFRKAFPRDRDLYTVNNVARAIAAFERTLVSYDSPYDRFRRGDDSAITESAKRGEVLFFLDYGPSCFRCHSGLNFSDSAVAGRRPEFHNTGLYNRYLPPNEGLSEHTGQRKDNGKYKAPGLRNIAITAPYMHDGSIATLEEVLDHYAAGGRAGSHPAKDRLIRGFVMTPQNRRDLAAFLQSLTDETLLSDPRLADPWSSAGDY